jgi:hypothetical protein
VYIFIFFQRLVVVGIKSSRNDCAWDVVRHSFPYDREDEEVVGLAVLLATWSCWYASSNSDSKYFTIYIAYHDEWYGCV